MIYPPMYLPYPAGYDDAHSRRPARRQGVSGGVPGWVSCGVVQAPLGT